MVESKLSPKTVGPSQNCLMPPRGYIEFTTRRKYSLCVCVSICVFLRGCVVNVSDRKYFPQWNKCVCVVLYIYVCIVKSFVSTSIYGIFITLSLYSFLPKSNVLFSYPPPPPTFDEPYTEKEREREQVSQFWNLLVLFPSTNEN